MTAPRVFGVVDKVIETGQDPRRFTEDLLRRLRDLVIVAAVPDAPATGLIDVAEDQAERLVAQAARFGPAELIRAADLVATGLTEMRGATAPRLLLELICARVLLPGADHSTEGVAGAPRPARAPDDDRRWRRGAHSCRAGPRRASTRRAARRAALRGDSACPDARAARAREPVVDEALSPAEPSRVETRAEPAPAAGARARAPAGAPAGRPRRPGHRDRGRVAAEPGRRTPDLARPRSRPVKQRRRFTWILLTQNAQVIAVDAETLTVGLQQRRRARLLRRRRQRRDRAAGRDRRDRSRLEGRDHRRPRCRGRRAATTGRAGRRAPSVETSPSTPPAAVDEVAPEPAAPVPSPSATARQAIAPTRTAGGDEAAPERPADADGGARPDDDDAESAGLDGAELLQQALGAQVIEEIPHQ